MNRMRLWISAAIIAFVILVAFALSVPHTRDLGPESASIAPAATVPTVALRDAFKNGTHTITGSVETPDACTTVSASASVSGSASNTEGILVALILESDPGVCLQVPTRADFKTTVSAPAALPITATVNGSIASTTPS